MKKQSYTSLLSLLIVLFSAPAYAQNFTKVSTGTQFNLALRSDSTLWAWGFNENGQLGSGDTTIRLSPVLVAAGHKWITMAAGAFHSLAIASDSTLWGWGDNIVNELGLGASVSINDTPMQIDATHHWKSVSAGYANSAAIRSDGTLWTAGENYYGALGTGDTDSHTTFVQVGAANDWKAVSIGFSQIIAIKNDGSLWGWGFDLDGEIGLDTTYRYLVPTRVGTANDWAAVSAGFEYSLALKTNGTVWSCGFNGNGQLGRASSFLSDSVLTQIDTITNRKFISAGSSHAFAIAQDGTLWGWGYNGAGQLGLPASTDVAAPIMVTADTNWQYISAATGAIYGSSVLGLSSTGFKTGGASLCTAGDNSAAELGNGTIGGTQEYFDCSIGTTAVPVLPLQKQEIVFYPNPAYDVFYISDKNSHALNPSVNIYNTLGQAISVPVNSNSGLIEMNVSNLAPGVYNIVYKTADGITTSHFVKE